MHPTAEPRLHRPTVTLPARKGSTPGRHCPPRPAQRAALALPGRITAPPARQNDAQNHAQPTVTGSLGAERPRGARSSPTCQHAMTIRAAPPRKRRRSGRRAPGLNIPAGTVPASTGPHAPLNASWTGGRPRPWWSGRRATARGRARRRASWPPRAMTRRRSRGCPDPPSECPLRSPPGGDQRGPAGAYQTRWRTGPAPGSGPCPAWESTVRKCAPAAGRDATIDRTMSTRSSSGRS